ncbi:AcrR family transcriptional regulator [Microbacterium sp. W4I4]|nr:AcrR family transcriptional regulator [Microbacterium sp. W4I4]
MGDVDDAIGLGCGLPEIVEVAKVATAGRGAERGDSRCALVGSDEAGDLVAGGEEFGDDVRTGMAGAASDEYMHTGLNGLSPVYYSAYSESVSISLLPPGGSRPKRADAVRNHQRLIAAAQEVLAEHGPAGITMDGLAERTGLGKGTVVRAFGSRAGIFRDLLGTDELAFQERVMRGEPPLGPGTGPVERLIAYGRARYAHLVDHLQVMRETLEPGSEVPASGVQFTQIHIRMLLAQAHIGVEDLDNLAVQLTLALEGPLLLALHAPPPATARNVGLFEDSWQTLIERVCTRPASES